MGSTCLQAEPAGLGPTLTWDLSALPSDSGSKPRCCPVWSLYLVVCLIINVDLTLINVGFLTVTHILCVCVQVHTPFV